TDYSKLRDSLRSLDGQLRNYEGAAARAELTEMDREAIRDSAVKRFELAFEMSWKFLKRYLTEDLGLAETPNSPKPILRVAAENQLLGDQIDDWLQYADARVATSHDYSGEKAVATLQVAPRFLVAAIRLYEVMTGEVWT
ncbi:MAG: HI0074 family nucleotidyltransferase substrate-binding subunit, partial [Fimbriimonas sp.]